MIKNISILLIAILSLTGICFAQSNTINGVWLLSEMHEGDQTYPVNMHVSFKTGGIIDISGSNAGTWTTNESDNTLTIKCDYLQFIEGINSIETLNDSEIKLKNTNGDTNSFEKISRPKDKELNNDIIGEWLLENIETDGKTNFIGQPVDFNKNGIFYVQEMVLGTWDYNESDKTLLFDTKKLKGKHSIIKQDVKKLIIQGEGGTMPFSKIDIKNILKENTESGIIGTWKFKTIENPERLNLLTFKSPDLFVLLEKQEGMKGETNGTWQFNKTDKTLLLIGQLEILRGLNKVISINDKTLTLENNGVHFTMNKEEQQANKIERLSFSEADFFDGNGNYKYESNSDKLPWQDSYQMIAELSQVKQLVYSYDTLIESSNTFDKKTLTADVSANQEEGSLRIDNIFNGYDRYNLPEDSAMPENNYDSYNSLYPLESDTFRVVSNEELTTPAGTFACTVVEATGSFDLLIKIWMINDNPGIFAKVVTDTSGSRGNYVVYQLQDIK